MTLIYAQGQINPIAAGAIAQAIPAMVFTLIIRRYILQMWGGIRI